MSRVLALSLLLSLFSQSVWAVEVKPAAPAKSEAAAAATDKIQWQSWSDRQFDQAKAENKLVILDLEAVWCHWCHVMEERTYSNPDVSRLIKEHFIAVKVDQNSRPDLSNKYSDWGWPATIIFNSDGSELVKRAGYIPADEMSELLARLVKNPQPEEAAKEEKIEFAAEGALSDKLRKELVARHIKGYDTKNGAWSFGQKFLDPESVDYAMWRGRLGDAAEQKMARQTLDQQLNLLDPVWGGMYQYSTHDDWKHAHFEKIMQVQAENMRVYAHAYEQYHDPKYLAASQAIYRFLTRFLLSPEGAFYTSQDADVVAGKHSDSYFKLNDAARRKQGIPRVDKHIYARENGWAINGLVALYQASGDKTYLTAAERAARWVEANRAIAGTGGYRHDQQDAAGPYLGDTLYMGQALLSLYAATGDRAWLQRAMSAGDFMAKNFRAPEGAPGLLTAVARTGAVKPEPLLDENIAAARYFNLLSRYSGKQEYKEVAQNVMRYLAAPKITARRKIFVAGFLLADSELSSDPVHITVVGAKSDPQALALFQAAQKYPAAYKQVEWYDKKEGNLPSGDVEFPPLPRAAAFGCAFQRCSLPIFDPADIGKTVDAFAKSK